MEAFHDFLFTFFFMSQGIPCYVYCPICNLAFPGYDCFPLKHPDHTGEPIDFPGIYVQVFIEIGLLFFRALLYHDIFFYLE